MGSYTLPYGEAVYSSWVNGPLNLERLWRRVKLLRDSLGPRLHPRTSSQGIVKEESSFPSWLHCTALQDLGMANKEQECSAQSLECLSNSCLKSVIVELWGLRSSLSFFLKKKHISIFLVEKLSCVQCWFSWELLFQDCNPASTPSIFSPGFVW